MLFNPCGLCFRDQGFGRGLGIGEAAIVLFHCGGPWACASRPTVAAENQVTSAIGIRTIVQAASVPYKGVRGSANCMDDLLTRNDHCSGV